MQATGIGPTLRNARVLAGKSIEEASRDTRIRAEYLEALERERFGALLGDVYVRGFLRSYATYLGLDSSDVIAAYNRRSPSGSDDGEAASSAAPDTPSVDRPLGGPARRHPSWRLLVGAALMVLAVLGAVGALSRSAAVPDAEEAPRAAGVPPAPERVTVSVRARAAVRATIRIDGGAPQTYRLRAGDSRFVIGQTRVDVSLDRGGAATLVVNGYSVGLAGIEARPYSASFGPQDFRSPPSATSP